MHPTETKPGSNLCTVTDPLESLMANRYEHKDSPYSSHSLLLSTLPVNGHGKQILDVGCWDGSVSSLYLERGFKVVGIEQIRHHNLPQPIELIEANLNDGLPPVSGTFNYIICADVLEHLLNPQAVLSQLRNHLSSDGKLLASLPNSGHWFFRLMVLCGYFPKQDNGLFDRTHLHFFTLDGWRELFHQSGYTIESVTPTSLPVSKVFPSWSRWLTVGIGERAQSLLGKIWLRLFAYQFVIEAKIK